MSNVSQSNTPWGEVQDCLQPWKQSTVSYYVFFFTGFPQVLWVNLAWGNFFKLFFFILKKHLFISDCWLKFGGLRSQREVEAAGGAYSPLGRRLRIASDLCRPQRPRRWGRRGSRGWPTCAKTCGSHGQTWCRRNKKTFTRLNWEEKVCCANISHL